MALLLVLAGCSFRVGSADSTGAWEKSADQVLGTAVSSLGTAELLLENQSGGRVTRSYTVVGLRDAVEVLDKESVTFLTARPPASAVELDRRAVALVEGSLQVLHTAAIAAAGTRPADREEALRLVRGARSEVQDFQDELPKAMP